MHTSSPPSEWLLRWSHLLPAGAHVLDLACGSGRHLSWLAAQGHAVTGVDRDAAALAPLAGLGTCLVADIENGPWPLAGRPFDAVLVTNYLWRPLWPHILDAVAPGGLLLYETFADGNAAYGKPSRPDFLLAPGELLQVCAGWQVVAYEHGLRHQPDRVLQRIVARKPLAGTEPLAPAPLQP